MYKVPAVPKIRAVQEELALTGTLTFTVAGFMCSFSTSDIMSFSLCVVSVISHRTPPLVELLAQ